MKSQNPYIIAEVNSSHFGKIETALKMIDELSRCKVDCVKFQSWTSETLYSKEYYNQNKIAHRVVKGFSFSEEQLLELSRACDSYKLSFSSTPYSIKEATFLVERCNVPFIKVASMELNNLEFLNAISQLGKPVVLSTGMGTVEEIIRAVNIFKHIPNNDLVILHCNATYPTELKEANLKNISLLKNLFPENRIGFSDHTLGSTGAICAVGLGAVVFEKHFTLDKSRIGMDNQMALESPEMSKYVNDIQHAYSSLGEYHRFVSDGEELQKLKMRRSLHWSNDLQKGHIIRKEDLFSIRPGTGLEPSMLENIIQKVLVCDVNSGSIVEKNHFE